MKDWLRAQGVEPVFIRKASPQQNCYVERFNGTMRDELLDRELFRTLTEARVVINGGSSNTTRSDPTGAWDETAGSVRCRHTSRS